MKDYSEAIINIKNNLRAIQSVCEKDRGYDETFDLIYKLYEDVGKLNAYCQFQQIANENNNRD
jgi:hypothetical protein|tara:strand:+ start:583 stop:771 length:189 start_codon:yes stop_codon:yes gene_type:complete